jgi:hypothetical protein
MTYRSAGTALTNAQIDSNIKTVENRYNGIPIASATTGLPDVSAGYRITVKFSGAPQLTHSSTFIMPGGANITAAAGDVAVFQQEDTGTQVWRCVSYMYAANVLETYVTQTQDNDTTKVATTAFVDTYAPHAGGWKLAGTFTGDGNAENDLVTLTGISPKQIRVVYNGLVGVNGSPFGLFFGLRGGDDTYAATEAGTSNLWDTTHTTWGSIGPTVYTGFDSGSDICGVLEFERQGSGGRYYVNGVCWDTSGSEHFTETAGIQVIRTDHVTGIRVYCTAGVSTSGSIDVWVRQ